MPPKATLLIKGIWVQIMKERLSQGCHTRDFLCFLKNLYPVPLQSNQSQALKSPWKSRVTILKAFKYPLYSLDPLYDWTNGMSQCFPFSLYVCSLRPFSLSVSFAACINRDCLPEQIWKGFFFLAEAIWGQETTQLSFHSYSLRGREDCGLGTRLPLCQLPHQLFSWTITTIEIRIKWLPNSHSLSLSPPPQLCNTAYFSSNENMFICQTESCPTVLGVQNFNHSSCCEQTEIQVSHLFWLTLKYQFRHSLEQNGAWEQSQATEGKQQSCNRLFVC